MNETGPRLNCSVQYVGKGLGWRIPPRHCTSAVERSASPVVRAAVISGTAPAARCGTGE